MRTITVIVLPVLAFFTLGCSGMMGGTSSVGGGGNKAACMAWVEKHNSLECLSSVKMDAATSCPDQLDMAGVPDQTSRYNCMAENTKCNGAVPDMAGLSSCN